MIKAYEQNTGIFMGIFMGILFGRFSTRRIFFHTQNLDEAPIKTRLVPGIWSVYLMRNRRTFLCTQKKDVSDCKMDWKEPKSDAKTSDIDNWIKGPWHTLEIHENEQICSLHNISQPTIACDFSRRCVSDCVFVCAVQFLGPGISHQIFGTSSLEEFHGTSGALPDQKRTWFARSLMFKPVCNNDP